jgi:hypothetical protein
MHLAGTFLEAVVAANFPGNSSNNSSPPVCCLAFAYTPPTSACTSLFSFWSSFWVVIVIGFAREDVGQGNAARHEHIRRIGPETLTRPVVPLASQLALAGTATTRIAFGST